MVNATIETIGPEQAKALLELNTENFRKPDLKRVDIYSQEMKAGKWKLNGDTIKFNGHALIDGQHRLLAIVKSKVAIQTIVVRGIDNDGKTVDRGKPRTISQWCTHSGMKYSAQIAAAAKLIIAHNKGFWSKITIQSNDVIDSEIFDFISQHRDRLQLCAGASMPAKPVISASLVTAVLFLGCGDRDPNNVELASWFVQALGRGEMLASSDAVFHLRNRLLSQNSQSRLDPFMKRALLTIAWNKTVKGEPCSSAALRLRLAGPSRQNAPEKVLQVEN